MLNMHYMWERKKLEQGIELAKLFITYCENILKSSLVYEEEIIEDVQEKLATALEEKEEFEKTLKELKENL